MINKKYFIVENADSKGFYLEMDFLEGDMSFTTDLGVASHYGSEDIAQIAVDAVDDRGFKMNLEIKVLEVTYNVKGLSL